MKKDPRFKKQEYQKDQVQSYLKGAKNKLKTAKKIFEDDEEASYQMAYEAMLKSSLALLLRKELRPRSQPGHHMAIIEKSGEFLGSQAVDLIKLFDEMRRNRNQFLYEPFGLVSNQEVKEALKIAQKYITLVEKKIGFNPSK